MSKNPGGSGRKQANLYQLEELFVKWNRSPAGVAWRWRAELAVLAVLGIAFWYLDTWTRSAAWAGIILAASVGLAAGVPHSRRFLTRRAWCFLARHRIHRFCYEARLHTRSGRLPIILRIWPTQVGERVWVLCRAGMSAEDFQDRTDELRSACYARDVRVTRSRRWSHLVAIDIIRRDTLAASNVITSPLARLTAPHSDHPALALLPPLGTTGEHDPAA
ncbi:MAG: hypothetical protein ACRDPY_07960 [Streptosporangiaceae bacterium]